MGPDQLRGHLEMLLLASLASGPAHGYALSAELRRRSNGLLAIVEGSSIRPTPPRGRRPGGELLGDRRGQATASLRVDRRRQSRPRRGDSLMANVPGLRRRRAAGDPMTDDEQIRTYMRRVQSSLHVRKVQRPRVIEEIENHLQEGAAEHMRGGATRAQAVAHAIEELGPPETVAAAFSDEGPPVPPRTGLVRWLPMLVPIALLTATVGFIVWSITLYPGGSTLGERTFQTGLSPSGGRLRTPLLRRVPVHQACRSRRAWRWAAWACTGGALTYLAIWN